MIEVNENKIPTLFFARKNCQASNKALNHLNRLGFKVTSIFTKNREQFNLEEVEEWSGDYIFCFRSTFILPKRLLEKAKIASINFHPGSPEYPGSGCINYALYENSKNFGVTAHIMVERVDEGEIIKCIRFPIKELDTVNSLLERTHLKLLNLFMEVTTNIKINGKNYINESIKNSKSEKWKKIKRKITDLDQLQIVDKNISEDELKKLIRATFTKKFPPKIVLYGYEFLMKSDKNK